MHNYEPNVFELTMKTFDGTVTKRTFQKESLSDVLEEMEYFLRGCGFFFDGQLDVVKDDYDVVIEEPELSEEDLSEKSEWYFDKDRNR